MKNDKKIDALGVQSKLLWFDNAKIDAMVDAIKDFIKRKSHYLVVRRVLTAGAGDFLAHEYCKKIDSYKDVIKRSYIKSNGAVYSILRCIGACVSDSLEHQDKVLRVGEALAVFDANVDAVLSGSERIIDYSQISETRRKEQTVSENVNAKNTVNFAEALESGDSNDVEKAIAESVKQKELLDKTREEAQRNAETLDEVKTNFENSNAEVDIQSGIPQGGQYQGYSSESVNYGAVNNGVSNQNGNTQNLGSVGGYTNESQMPNYGNVENANGQSFVNSNAVQQPVETPQMQTAQDSSVGNVEQSIQNFQPSVAQNYQGSENLYENQMQANANNLNTQNQYAEQFATEVQNVGGEMPNVQNAEPQNVVQPQNSQPQNMQVGVQPQAEQQYQQNVVRPQNVVQPQNSQPQNMQVGVSPQTEQQYQQNVVQPQNGVQPQNSQPQNMQVGVSPQTEQQYQQNAVQPQNGINLGGVQNPQNMGQSEYAVQPQQSWQPQQPQPQPQQPWQPPQQQPVQFGQGENTQNVTPQNLTGYGNQNPTSPNV